MSGNKKRKLSAVPKLRDVAAAESEERVPEVRVVKDEDVPMGKAAPVPSPTLMFRHSGPALPGARREDEAPRVPVGAAVSEPETPDPAATETESVDQKAETETDTGSDTGGRKLLTKPEDLIPAKRADLKHLSRDEIRAIRQEERRLKRVLEGLAAPQPGDPVPGAPPSIKEQKQNKSKTQKNLQDIHVPPVAQAAQMRRRHWGILTSLLLMVIVPLALVAGYLNLRAVDQYASVAGFTVRSEEGGASSLLTGLAASISGGSAQTDTDILYEFIQSPSMVTSILDHVDLYAHYSAHWDTDPIYSLDPEATAEDLLDYWARVVLVSYDQSSGLMEMRVQAFDADTAQTIAQAILSESQALINELNAQARADKLSYSEQDLDEARKRLRETREALILFRTRTQIVDPLTDLQGRLGVVNSLQQQLAEALIEQDLLREQTSDTDPRFVQVRRRIEVIRERIGEERASVASGDATTSEDEAYPKLLAEYEGLLADREFAEETYRAALLAYDVANASTTRQTRYLASYVQPTRPQTAEYPRRLMTFGLAALFLMLIWSVVVLVYYSIRDSK